jgi:hypothetical protein
MSLNPENSCVPPIWDDLLHKFPNHFHGICLPLSSLVTNDMEGIGGFLDLIPYPPHPMDRLS